MNLLQDVITYVRRLVKSANNSVITDNLIIDYINRFWLMDVDARLQLFDLKTTYIFQTIPGIASYNMPLYNTQVQPGAQQIASYPVYQGFSQPCYVNGIQMPFYTEPNAFWNLWPNYTQFLNPAAVGNGTDGPYTISIPFFPAVPGYLDITGIIANINNGNGNQDPFFTNSFPLDPTGNFINIPTTSFYPTVYFTATNENGSLIQVSDSGVFLTNGIDQNLYGLLMEPGKAPIGNEPLGIGGSFNVYTTTQNTINYNTGVANVTFPDPIPDGANINAECIFIQQGIPRAVLFYNNCLTIRPPPDISYKIELSAYLSPAAFLSTAQAIPFGYMAEYLARGAARKILSDTGDIEQFQFYEPLFREQEMLVWKRSQRQFTATRTGTIFSDLQGQSNYNNIGQGST